MKIIYNSGTDTLFLLLKDTPVAESDELRKGFIVDYDKSGKIVSLEILDASEIVSEPNEIFYKINETKAV